MRSPVSSALVVALFVTLTLAASPRASWAQRDVHKETPVSHEHDDTSDASLMEETAEYAKEVWGRDKLTGDWAGFRTDAKDHGLDVEFTLSQFYQGSPRITRRKEPR